MISLPFKVDRKLTDVLREERFTLSAEVIPPRNGTEQLKALEQIHALVQSGAQFLSVTKGAGGSLRGGSLPIAQSIKEQLGVPAIAHFTCRDLTPHEVENSLMDHHYFGIRNILALRGDPPDGQTQWQPRPGGYSYAYELIRQIRALNTGTYMSRASGPGVVGEIARTDFCIGAAAYPEHPDPAERIEFFRLKVEAGAEYGMTDMLFDPESYARFRDGCEKAHATVPLLPGTRILKSRAQAQKMAAKFRVSVPESVLARLPEVEDKANPEESLKAGVECFLELVEKLRNYGAPGVHLYVIADTGGASRALTELRTLVPGWRNW